MASTSVVDVLAAHDEIDVASSSVRRTLLTVPVPERADDDSVIQPQFDEDAFSASTCYDCHSSGGAEPKYAGTARSACCSRPTR
jgi:hypothetical protein